MLPTHTLTALAALLPTILALDIGLPGPYPPTSPFITLHNTSPHPICYKIEFTSGSFPAPTTCDSSPGILVSPSQTLTLHPGATFNGALTAITNNIKGARLEINFAASPSGTWYDVDYQLGMSDSTLGPADHRPRVNGNQHLPSVSGEQDTLAKAQAAWPHTDNKDELLKYPQYVKEGADGKLERVYMDGAAPGVVVEFFQLTAEFVAYVGSGGGSGEVDRSADLKSWWVDTRGMEVVGY